MDVFKDGYRCMIPTVCVSLLYWCGLNREHNKTHYTEPVIITQWFRHYVSSFRFVISSRDFVEYSKPYFPTGRLPDY